MCGSNLDAGQLVSVSASQLEKASRLADDENKENGDKVLLSTTVKSFTVFITIINYFILTNGIAYWDSIIHIT